MLKLSTTVFAAIAAFAATPATAANILTDGGFEAQGAASTGNYCYFGFATAGGPACQSGAWASNNLGGGLQVETNGAWPGVPSPDGSFYGFIQAGGSLTQAFTPTQSGTYSLNWIDAGRPNIGCCAGDQNYYVTIDDGVSLAPLLYLGGTTSFQPWTARQAAFTFGLTAGTAYTLTFQGTSRSDNTAFIDGVSLDLVPGAVPEPAAWAFMLAGFGLVGGAMRRRGAMRVVSA